MARKHALRCFAPGPCACTKCTPETIARARAFHAKHEGTGYDPFIASRTLLVKLGSLLVHAEEALSDDGREVDRDTFAKLMDDFEVRQWRSAMDAKALLPKKRKGT